MPKNQTSFSSTNQPKNRKGKTERTKILEALKRAAKTEDEFYDLLVDKAFNKDDINGFSEMLKRISPVPKQVAPEVEFEFPQNAKPHEQASAVMHAISSGQIPADIGATFIHAIKNSVEIEESTELKDRISALEKLLNVSVG